MSVKISKSLKLIKLARYSIDMLAVYSSENEIQVPLEVAMNKINLAFSKKSDTAKLDIQKCILYMYAGNDGSHTIIIKNNKKQVLETFSTKSIGIPQVGQLGTQDLVFLPVLNKDNKSELFVFHPKNVSAQEVVIRIVKLIQMKDNVDESSVLITSPSPPKSEVGDIIPTPVIVENHITNGHKRANNDHEEVRSEYSLTPSFFNNWYCKVEQMVSNIPASLYQGSDYGSSINDELHLLNQYLKEIRAFMNKFYDIMQKAVLNSTIENDHVLRVAKLPSKAIFVEVIQKIKYSLNIASVHESMIINPSAKEIVNQLLLILKIISDATVNKITGEHDLVAGIKDPEIVDTTSKYLTDNLNTKNKEFWMSLGRHYGVLTPFQRTLVDEFEIRQDTVNKQYEPERSVSPDRFQDRRTQRGYESNPVRDYDRDQDRYMDNQRTQRSYDISPARNYDRGTQRSYNNISPMRDYDRYEDHKPRENKFYKHYNSDNDVFRDEIYSTKRLNLSQPQINYPEKPRSIFDYDDDIYRSYPRMYAPETEVYNYQAEPIIQSYHQKSERVIPNGYDNGRQNSLTWESIQNRFIDAVQLRNGRLMKISRDRPAQTGREIAVSYNERVELLSNHGEMVMVKNALGEVGYCPSSIAQMV